MLSLIPIMTSNTTPSGTTSASSVFNSNYNAFNAFVPDNGNWISSTNTGWLRYQFPNATVINNYSLMHWTAGTDAMPKNWTFEGSNDGTNWTVLDTQTNQEKWQTKEEREYSFSNVIKYVNYRINCSLNNGNANLSVGYIAMNYQLPSVHKILLSSNSKTCSLEQKIKTNQKIIPQMTSDSSNGVTVLGDTRTASSFPAWKAFDYNIASNSAWVSDNSSTASLEINLNPTQSKLTPFSYTIQGCLAGVTNVPLAPKEWVVYGFRNESWEELDSRKNIVDWSINEIKEFVLDTTHSFSRYKIEVISSVSDSRKSIAEFNFYASSNSGAKLINLPNQSEQTFINHGMDSPININQLNGIKSIESDSTTHESGNKYTHTVDLSKRRVDKIILS